LKKILLIESDQGLISALVQALNEAQFKVITASDSGQGIMALYENCPDMVIIDENLPWPGIEWLCTQLQRISHIPIIILTDGEEGPAAAEFMEMGADACLAKPFLPRLFLARVNSLFRRCGAGTGYHFPQGIDLNCEAHRVSLEGATIELTPTEFRLFSCLMLNESRIVPYHELAMGVWGQGNVSPGSIKFYAHALRKKLHGNGRRRFHLFNGRGIGFRFIPGSPDDEKHPCRLYSEGPPN
jgi:DNA-binding response OmpR family regulator